MAASSGCLWLPRRGAFGCLVGVPVAGPARGLAWAWQALRLVGPSWATSLPWRPQAPALVQACAASRTQALRRRTGLATRSCTAVPRVPPSHTRPAPPQAQPPRPQAGPGAGPPQHAGAGGCWPGCGRASRVSALSTAPFINGQEHMPARAHARCPRRLPGRNSSRRLPGPSRRLPGRNSSNLCRGTGQVRHDQPGQGLHAD